MHMNANEPVEAHTAKIYLSAEVVIPCDSKMSDEEFQDYREQVIRKYIREEPTVNIENKQLEDVE